MNSSILRYAQAPGINGSKLCLISCVPNKQDSWLMMQKYYRISFHDMTEKYKYSFKNPIIAASLFASNETLL
jgi:hypothetical protein